MTSIDNMAAEIMNGLTEYADLANESMKKAVKKTATEVKKKSPPMRQKTPVLMRKAGRLKRQRKTAILLR